MEPRGLEPLTSCLQIGMITRDNGLDLGEKQPASDREYALSTARNGPLMARPSCLISAEHLQAMPDDEIVQLGPNCYSVACGR
ncbi:hypothetical protein Msi02_84760 [Microbispora siamensis]|uniref:Uncharacterized protein n=1 Tax=Microbispora siamensis TaxID=564413 RepID=A0ABQ4H1U1_9ACTN|nr:hypothetical protein Msi02_84760 [Microbispora siamensis]